MEAGSTRALADFMMAYWQRICASPGAIGLLGPFLRLAPSLSMTSLTTEFIVMPFQYFLNARLSQWDVVILGRLYVIFVVAITASSISRRLTICVRIRSGPGHFVFLSGGTASLPSAARHRQALLSALFPARPAQPSGP